MKAPNSCGLMRTTVVSLTTSSAAPTPASCTKSAPVMVRSPSNHMIRRKPAGVLGIARLDLQRGVGNPEPAIQLMGDFMQQAVVGPRARAHQVRRHGGVRGAFPPHVAVVGIAFVTQDTQRGLH